MKMLVIQKQSHKTTNWSGGTTTELFIYPRESEYQKKNFLFRVSTATIEIEESQFTKLDEVNRKIMILDGKIELIHEGRYSKNLDKFDTDTFSGEWNTRSIGKATDFNLMTKGNVSGHILHLGFETENAKTVNFNVKTQKALFYIYSGKLQICEKTVESGDVIFFETLFNDKSIDVKAVTKSDIIVVELAGF
ncbi:MAG TPA: HutD family protein [Bacteroidales bacterium]|nr:HutD family protein [Bacteroidales bacterium]HPL04760.1 HutD family protein [Bacteroidales bacterium]